jgi:hypothetical protein
MPHERTEEYNHRVSRFRGLLLREPAHATPVSHCVFLQSTNRVAQELLKKKYAAEFGSLEPRAQQLLVSYDMREGHAAGRSGPWREGAFAGPHGDAFVRAVLRNDGPGIARSMIGAPEEQVGTELSENCVSTLDAWGD